MIFHITETNNFPQKSLSMVSIHSYSIFIYDVFHPPCGPEVILSNTLTENSYLPFSSSVSELKWGECGSAYDLQLNGRKERAVLLSIRAKVDLVGLETLKLRHIIKS